MSESAEHVSHLGRRAGTSAHLGAPAARDPLPSEPREPRETGAATRMGGRGRGSRGPGDGDGLACRACREERRERLATEADEHGGRRSADSLAVRLAQPRSHAQLSCYLRCPNRQACHDVPLGSRRSRSSRRSRRSQQVWSSRPEMDQDRPPRVTISVPLSRRSLRAIDHHDRSQRPPGAQVGQSANARAARLARRG